MIKKIVDSNFLQNPKLRDYLNNSKSNFVIITDYLAIEAYNEPSGKAILRSMDILQDFTNQVYIAKNTIEICGFPLDARSSFESLIDPNQTKEFKKFCDDLKSPFLAKKYISVHQEIAKNQMKRIQNDTYYLLDGFNTFQSFFTQTELKLIRLKEGYSKELNRKLYQYITTAAFEMLKNHPSTKRLPKQDELLYSFIFRNCLCGVLLYLQWIENGNRHTVKPERIRNDIIDCNFASYALYFDGLLTSDKKLNHLYHKAMKHLHEFKDYV